MPFEVDEEVSFLYPGLNRVLYGQIKKILPRKKYIVTVFNGAEEATIECSEDSLRSWWLRKR